MGIKSFNYYRLKVGYGNELFWPCVSLSLQINNRERLKKELVVGVKISFFIGFDSDSWIPKIDDKGAITIIHRDGKSTEWREHRTDDLYFLSLAQRDSTASQIMVFENDKLYIFKPTGQWGWRKNVSVENLIKLDSPLKVDRDISEKIEKTSDSRWGHILEFSYFEVKLQSIHERDRLPACLDSLAVYQYLSRGTFRPLSRVGAGRDEFLKKSISKDRELVRLSSYSFNRNKRVVAEKTDDECYLAYLYRILLDHLISGSPDDRKSFFKGIEHYLLAPVQLEAAAALFLRDLGYMPDFYVGKSLDRIDVRGRKIESCYLKKSEVLRGRIGITEYKNIIRIQCKDYELKNFQRADHVYLFTPDGVFDKERYEISLRYILDVMSEVGSNFDCKFELQIWWDLFRETLYGK